MIFTSWSHTTGTDSKAGDIKISILKVCISGKVTSWHSWGARAGCNPEAAGWRGSELPHVHWSSLWESSRTGAHTDAWGTHEERLQQRIECDLPDTLLGNVKALPNRVRISASQTFICVINSLCCQDGVRGFVFTN